MRIIAPGINAMHINALCISVLRINAWRWRINALFFCWVFLFLPPAWGQEAPGRAGTPRKSEWYISNAGGMTLEKAQSRFAALRNPYCLLVEEGFPPELPDLLRPYYRAPWSVELRVLYKEGEESRRQWLFRDGSLNRLAAVFTRNAGEEAEEETREKIEETGADPEKTGEIRETGEGEETSPSPGKEETRPLGFIEVFGDHGFIIMERQFLEDGEMIINYIYNAVRDQGNFPGTRQTLVRADTRRRSFDGEERALYTDYYRYTRNHSLRLIERIFPPRDPSGAPEEDPSGESPSAAPVSAATLRFPRRSLDSEKEINFVSPVLAYGSQFFEDVQAGPSHRIIYTTDERGRILTETRMDEDENIIGELRNTWSGGHLSKVTWIAGEEERVTEYSYNRDGDRIEERNYRNGIMERLVRIQGDQEEEELYMNGEPILRTLWEGGRKIREEEVRPGRSRRGASPRVNP